MNGTRTKKQGILVGAKSVTTFSGRMRRLECHNRRRTDERLLPVTQPKPQVTQLSSLSLLSRHSLLSVLLLFFLGCGPSATTQDDEAAGKKEIELRDLKVLVVDDPGIGPVIARQWAARRDANLEIVDITTAELEAAEFAIDRSIDVVIYPPRLLGDFVADERFGELDDSVWNDTEQFNKKELLRHARTTNVRWANRVWAVPLGGPQFVLLYRADVLKQIDEKPPKTWEDFARIAEKLSNSEGLKDAEGTPLPTKVSLPLANYWRAQMLLLRSAPYVRSRGRISTIFDRNSLEPMIDNEGYARALAELKDEFASDYERLEGMTPGEVFKDISDGESAMAITWPSSAFMSEESTTEFADQIAICSIPTSRSVFDPSTETWKQRSDDELEEIPLIGFAGLLASVSIDSSNVLTARELLKWLPSKTISNSVLNKSVNTGPFRASHLGNPAKWTGGYISPEAAEEYAAVIRAANKNTVIVVVPRIPRQSKFIAVLDQAMQRVLKDGDSPAQALEIAAGEFADITAAMKRGSLNLWLKSSKEY